MFDWRKIARVASRASEAPVRVRISRPVVLSALMGALCLSIGNVTSTTAQSGGGSTGSAPASVRILTGTLVSPSAAQTYYGTSTTHTDGLCRDYGSNDQICPAGSSGRSPRAPELRELARALRGGDDLLLSDGAAVREHVDLVYEYVRNRIDTEFIFGSHKGALGTLIDSSGTAFDQAQLMVEVLRESGLNADYRFGTITLTPAQFTAWTGLSQARAACEFLALGGIPATVAGGCAGSGPTGNITLSHIWVAVSHQGQTWLYDPAYKPYEHISGIDVRQAMGLGEGQALSDTTGVWAVGLRTVYLGWLASMLTPSMVG